MALSFAIRDFLCRMSSTTECVPNMFGDRSKTFFEDLSLLTLRFLCDIKARYISTVGTNTDFCVVIAR